MDNPIQVIERVFNILTVVSENGGNPTQLGEIVAKTGLKPSTAARIAQTLTQCGALVQQTRKKGYIIGPKINALSRMKGVKGRLIEIAQPLLTEFSAKTGEYIDLSIMHSGQRQREIIARVSSTKNVQTLGAECFESPYVNLSGRLLLSGLTEKEQRRFFESCGAPGELWPEIKSEDELCAALASIRKERRLFRRIYDMSCVAVPLLAGGSCKATIGSSVPSYRYDERLAKLIDTEMMRIKECMERCMKDDGLFMDANCDENKEGAQ